MLSRLEWSEDLSINNVCYKALNRVEIVIFIELVHGSTIFSTVQVYYYMQNTNFILVAFFLFLPLARY